MNCTSPITPVLFGFPVALPVTAPAGYSSASAVPVVPKAPSEPPHRPERALIGEAPVRRHALDRHFRAGVRWMGATLRRGTVHPTAHHTRDRSTTRTCRTPRRFA